MDARETQAQKNNVENVRSLFIREVDRLLSTGLPEYGSLSIVLFLMDSDVSRSEVGATVSRKITPRSSRGGSN